jgi:hypothetical protein
MTTAIKYSVQGRAKEQTVSCYTIPSKIVTLRHIRRQFPFYGRFHFRCRFPPDRETNFAWMDLLDPDEPVPSFGGTIYLKVLQIPTPDSLLQDDETNTLQPAVRIINADFQHVIRHVCCFRHFPPLRVRI